MSFKEKLEKSYNKLNGILDECLKKNQVIRRKFQKKINEITEEEKKADMYARAYMS